ncbi:MAG: S8 family serine peptidase [Gaiellaceae bacterium]
MRLRTGTGSRANAMWGRRGESRQNALWGRTGKRANALWGRGGRSGIVLTLTALTLVVPLAAGAAGGGSPNVGAGTIVSPELLAQAAQHPGDKIHVIVQSSQGVSDATAKGGSVGRLHRRLGLIDGVAIDMPAARLNSLARYPGLTITADAPVKLSGTVSTVSSSNQMWPYESGVAKMWGTATSPAPQAPTIAVVDSGIDSNRSDFDSGLRVVGQVTMTDLTPNSAGDGRGHGTFVSGIAAGSAPGYAGAAPNAGILSIDVMNDSGQARTSDVIAACDYILASKGKFNIRVANFSLHSGAKNHFYNDPLDKAVEKLWFNGIFVVAAAGNYGSATGASGVLYAPGNDPFVMTVGAVDLGGKLAVGDDNTAPWSAYGYTEDGFAKPELSAPGRYMVGPVPMTSTLVAQKADHVVSPGYIELSGTSFAAPVVAGTAAQLLARHPGWTPDQLKGALMVTAKPVPQASRLAAGVGQLNAGRAADYAKTPPNPNAPLNRFVSSTNGTTSFDPATWNTTVRASASWGSASWADASWGDASWSTASWGDASWNAASWADASWADASWADASWADLSVEDAAEGDAGAPAPLMTAETSAELQADPDLALPVAQVLADPAVTDAVVSASTSVLTP